MAVTLPIEVYEIFEKGFGKESAKTVIKSLEQVIDTQVEDKWYRTKTELKEELLKDVATKADLEVLKRDLEARIGELAGKQERDKIELLGKLDRLNLTLKYLIVLMVLALTLMNPVVAEILKSLLKL